MKQIINRKFLKIIIKFIIICFALIGLIFSGVYVAMKYSLLNVKGSVSERNSYFNTKNITSEKNINNDFEIICKINVLSKNSPIVSLNIYKTLLKGTNDEVIKKMIKISSKKFEDDYDFRNEMFNCEKNNYYIEEINFSASPFSWAETAEWKLMKEVFTRDQDIIKKAGIDAGIEPRLILSGVIGEQFRFFGNRRESFKNYFEPLKILASLSNTSFGIAGLKPKTVRIIDENLKNRESEFYLGIGMENITEYNNTLNIETERLNRITNSKDPYYSYLYVGLFMRQIIAQWSDKGYNINNRPEVLATLYNLGFNYSIPKDNPQAGGAIIEINNIDYTFGDIAYEFYYSGELSDIFPIN